MELTSIFTNAFSLSLRQRRPRLVSDITAPFRPPVSGRLGWALYSTTGQEQEQVQEQGQSTVTVTIPENFDLPTALFCGGLAFDAYVEPASNSSRWEKGSRGMKVAFCSTAYARNLYTGLLEVLVKSCSGLPGSEDNAAEKLISGSGVDACVLVAALEGSWKEDVERLEKTIYHEGVLDLSGAAHVGRSSTAWSNVNQKASEKAAKTVPNGKPLPYHIPASWGRGGRAVWPEGSEQPFYLYLQDPSNVRLVFTILDDNKLMGDPTPIGSTYVRLTSLIPQANFSQQELVESIKGKVLAQLREAAGSGTLGEGDLSAIDEVTKTQLGSSSWEGELKLTSKPRKKDKNSQILTGVVAGAALAGPVGAAAGAVLGSMYEGEIKGRIELKLRYLPIPDIPYQRKTYRVFGGMPGIDWGTLYRKYRLKREDEERGGYTPLRSDDLEHCFFINHDITGATCAVYRSLESKLIVVSFRGTCTPIDLLTDANLVQDAWVEGEDVSDQATAKVHRGFRSSLDSISRRLKELLLACPAPGENISDYDMLVTGHSLGGALATLFTADVGQFGIDAGRALPQLQPSEPWWKSIASTTRGKRAQEQEAARPPRPRTLRLYNFGSPRVGNAAFAQLFDGLIGERLILQAYRIVNGEDVVARLPRTMNALMLGNVGYEHVGKTVLVASDAESDEEGDEDAIDTEDSRGAEDADDGGTDNMVPAPLFWIEGESDDSKCPVRDGSSPLAEGNTLSDMLEAFQVQEDGVSASIITRKETESARASWTNAMSNAFSAVSERFKNATAFDYMNLLGIDKDFSEREFRLIQSIFQGKAIGHHMEDQYYIAMGRAGGYRTRVGENTTEKTEAG